MNLRLRLLTGLLTGLLGGLLVAGVFPSTAPAAQPSPSDRRAAAKADYLYRGTYTATLVHTLDQQSRPGASEKRQFSTTLTGSLPFVEMDVDLSEVTALRSRGLAPARTDQTSAATASVADAYADDCSGTTATVSGKPRLYPTLLGGVGLQLFTSVEFPLVCTDNQGSGPVASRLLLAAVPVTGNLDKGRVGDRTITFSFSGDVTAPEGAPDDDSRCPGWAPTGSTSCQYTIKGKLTLTRVKKLGPSKDEPQPQGGATVTPGKVKLKTQCPAKCTIEIRVTPLPGGPTIVVDRITPRPGRQTTVTLPIPPKKRKVVKQSGGVRVSLTYRLAAGVHYSEIRTARL